MESVCVNTVILKEGKKDKNMNSHKMRGKMKFFETCPKKDPHCAKHAIFVTKMSHKQVANNLETKIGKICLSVFRDP